MSRYITHLSFRRVSSEWRLTRLRQVSAFTRPAEEKCKAQWSKSEVRIAAEESLRARAVILPMCSAHHWPTWMHVLTNKSCLHIAQPATRRAPQQPKPATTNKAVSHDFYDTSYKLQRLRLRSTYRTPLSPLQHGTATLHMQS